MRKINLLLVILLIVGLSTAYYLWSNKNKDGVISNSVKTIIESSSEIEKPIEGVSIQEKLKQNKANVTQLNKLLVDRVQAFDPDPAVDAKLIKINLSHCIKIINPEKHQEVVKSWKSIDKQSNTQIKYKQNLNTYCEDTHNKHPEYMLTNEDDLKILSDSITNDNETGKILSRFYNDENTDVETFDIASKIQHLKNTNPNLLLNVSYYFGPYLVEKFHFDVGTMIKSNDSSYVNIVRTSALDLYACNAGADCGMYSNMLARMCLNRNLCGNDFNDILTNKMSEGIRLDILLVYEFLKKSFG